MRGANRTFVIIFVICLAMALSISCAKKGMVQGEGESADKGTSLSTEKPAEIKEEVVSAPSEVAKAEEGAETMVEEASFADIHFDFDKYTIREDARPGLEKISDYLGSMGSLKLLIEGHCDERGTSEYNFALGERRAQAAKDYLVNLGVSASRIKTISYGEEKPMDPAHTEDAWAKNRRAHFVVLK